MGDYVSVLPAGWADIFVVSVVSGIRVCMGMYRCIVVHMHRHLN